MTNNNNNNSNGRSVADSAELIVPNPNRSLTAVDESALRLKRVADSFVVNARAKESIASTQMAQFFEVLCVRLRQRLAELEVKAKENAATAAVQQDMVVSGLSNVLSPTSFLGGQTGLAAVAMMMLSQGWIFQQMGIKTAFALLMATAVKRRVEQLIGNRQRRSYSFVVQQFITNANDTLHAERGVREVARALTMRHVDQIVPLTKASQSALADVMVNRIIRHLQRGRWGYPEESRSPLIATVQRSMWNVEMVYHGLMTPPDRIPERKTLTLLERCVRALTAEGGPEDEVPLELEAWFSSSRMSSQSESTQWTASGVLSKTGLRISSNTEKDAADVFYAHECSDVQIYGFAYGAEFEARERNMRVIANPFAAAESAGTTAENPQEDGTTSAATAKANGPRTRTSKL